MRVRWLITAWTATIAGIAMALIGVFLYNNEHNPYAEICRDFGIPATTPDFDCAAGSGLSLLGRFGAALGFGGAFLVLGGIALGLAWTGLEVRRRKQIR